MKSIHFVLARNSIWNLVRFAVNAGVVFVTTPLIIKSIGNAQYGLWALIFSLIGYAGLLELGIQQATIKLVAQFKGREDKVGLNIIASSCLFLLTCVGVVVALLCWFLLPVLVPLFVKDGEILGFLNLLLQLIAIDMVFVFVSQGLTGIVLGLQQYHFKCISDMLFALMSLGLTILVLAKGYGIVGLAGVKLSLDILACLSLVWISRTGYSRLRLSPLNVTGDGLRSILSIGGRLFLVTTVSRINNLTTPVVISSLLSTVWNAYYSVALRLVGYANQILWSATAVFLPMFSELAARNRPEEVQAIFFRYSRYILSLSVPMYLSLFLLGPAFIRLWINPEFAEMSRAALLLMAAEATVSGMQPLSERMVIGCGDVAFYSRLTTTTVVCALVLGIALVSHLGIAGPALAMLCLTTVQQAILAVHIARRMNMNMLSYFSQCHLRLAPAAVVFAVGVLVARTFLDQRDFTTFLLLLTGSAAFYAGVAVFTVLTAEERAFLARRIGLSRLASKAQPDAGKGE